MAPVTRTLILVNVVVFCFFAHLGGMLGAYLLLRRWHHGRRLSDRLRYG